MKNSCKNQNWLLEPLLDPRTEGYEKNIEKNNTINNGKIHNLSNNDKPEKHIIDNIGKVLEKSIESLRSLVYIP